LRRYLRDYAFLLLIGGLILALDQYTKIWVRRNLALYEVWNPFGDWLEPYARIVHITNTGMAFGQLPQFGLIFTVFSVLAILGVLYFYPRIPRQDRVIRLAMGMVLGGAAGNLLDRLSIGSVTDFISVGSFAIFNVADSSLSIAAALIVISNLPALQQERLASQLRRTVEKIRCRRHLPVLPPRRSPTDARYLIPLETALGKLSPPPRLVLRLRLWRIHNRRARRLDFWRALRLRR